jgi:two-component system response regulator
MFKPLGTLPRDAVILLVEDNPDHAYLLREAFAGTRARVAIEHVESGDQCMAFLRREPPYADAPRPDLILLDIHMPRMNGFEVMEAICADERLRALPVVVMTTSAEAPDVQRMYGLRCSSYVVKPMNFAKMAELARGLCDYWLNVVILPTAGDDFR